MKLRIFFSLFLVVCANADIIATNDSISSRCSCPIECIKVFYESPIDNKNVSNSESLSDSLSYVTALINSLNNNIATENKHLTVVNILIAMFGFAITGVGVVSFLGIKGFRESEKDIETFKNKTNNDLNSKYEKIEGMNKSIDEKIETIDNTLQELKYQNQYLQKINQYLFSITNSIIDNGGNSETVLVIRNSLYNQYYIVKTFLPWSDGPADSTQAAFMYLQFNGTKDNIDDLQFIADNDPDERKRNMALKTISFIRARLMYDPIY